MVEPTTHADSNADPATSAATQKEWRDTKDGRPLPFWSSVRDDIVAQVPPERRSISPLRWALRAARIGVTSPGFKVALLYRVNHALVNYTGLPGKVAAGVINRATHLVYGSAIAPKARLHGGLVLPHPQGIIIGGGVVVGPGTWIFQNVTMGATDGKVGEPTVGAHCRIYAGAVIGGPVTVGDQVVVSPNSLVQRSVPSQSLAVGVPANVFPKFKKPAS